MKNIRRLAFLCLSCLFIVSSVHAQSSCPAIVSDALTQLNQSCRRIGHNQACYGNLTLLAQSQAGVTDLKFAAPGDIESITRIYSLTLSGMNEAVPEWGVSLMSLQASLPNSLPGQNMTFLLFGSTRLTRDDATAAAAGYGNGMQAFTFASGIGDAHCAEAPDSGLLVQTNRGNAEVVFTVNGVQIWLSSTAYIQSMPGGNMLIYLVEGNATVSAFGVSRAMPAGTLVSVPVGGDDRAVAPSSEPQGYNMGIVQRLAPMLRVLSRRISLASPLDLSVCTLIAPANVNTRQGPDTEYGRGARLNANTAQPSTGATTGTDGTRWYQLASGAWVSAAVVNEFGPCDSVPQIQNVMPPSEAGASGRIPLVLEPEKLMYTWVINYCMGSPNPPIAGQPVRLGLGLGDWATPALRDAEVAGHSASITIDGMALGVHYEELFHNGGYGVNASAYWTATPGTHTVTGIWQGSRHNNQTTCSFTVSG